MINLLKTPTIIMITELIPPCNARAVQLPELCWWILVWAILSFHLQASTFNCLGRTNSVTKPPPAGVSAAKDFEYLIHGELDSEHGPAIHPKTSIHISIFTKLMKMKIILFPPRSSIKNLPKHSQSIPPCPDTIIQSSEIKTKKVNENSPSSFHSINSLLSPLDKSPKLQRTIPLSFCMIPSNFNHHPHPSPPPQAILLPRNTFTSKPLNVHATLRILSLNIPFIHQRRPHHQHSIIPPISILRFIAPLRLTSNSASTKIAHRRPTAPYHFLLHTFPTPENCPCHQTIAPSRQHAKQK